MIEKPYGHDEGSARALDDRVHTDFDESQVFRIDHYLGKDTVQNLMALRSPTRSSSRSGTGPGSTTCRSPWQRRSASAPAAASTSTPAPPRHPAEPRAPSAGAGADGAAGLVRRRGGPQREGQAAAVDPAADRGDIDRIAVRGQYTRGGTPDEPMPGYREEPGVHPLSRTETYAALRLDVDNWRWAGVPFYIRTGKRLPKRAHRGDAAVPASTHLPIRLDQVSGLCPDALILRIQPDEGITLRFGAKVPGHASSPVRDDGVQLRGHVRRGVSRGVRAAPARRADRRPTLFIRSDEVAQCWRIIDPIISYWADDTHPIPLYEAASWGPTEADRLLERDGRAWRNL